VRVYEKVLVFSEKFVYGGKLWDVEMLRGKLKKIPYTDFLKQIF
jgi:hypothetical protein